MGNTTKNAKPDKCPVKTKSDDGKGAEHVCNQDILHGASYTSKGTNERDEGVTQIALNALKESGKLDSKNKEDHFFYRQNTWFSRVSKIIENGKLASNSIVASDPIEGHHLITCEAVSEDSWYCIFKAFMYDINCAANCVILPGDMLAACHYGVPLHLGGHGATFGSIENGVRLNYVKSVEKMINGILETYTTGGYCHPLTSREIRDFHEEMLEISNDIFEKVEKFKWTITSDGKDYNTGGVGCYGGYRTITTKRNAMAKSLKMSLRGKARDVSEKLTEAIKERPCSRNHTEEGCRTLSVEWDKCKYNDIDNDIKNME
ncbi:MAG: AHH domain-containing protein [Tannerella sp.]|jgi:hypothetical protein|nr:AHH domain-containing protein [Tannerella sp.]